jgi:hypothetical protein
MMAETKYMRSAIVKSEQLKLRIDRAAGIVRGFAVLRAGDTHDGRYVIDQTTLQQTRDLINARAGGVKSRFTHPNLSNDGLGRRIGNVSKARIDGDVVRADLKLSKLADRSPVAGKMGQYVLDMAEESPDDFGASISYVESDLGDGGDGPPLLRVKSLRAVDIVDEPAATDGFFSMTGVGLGDGADLPDAAARQASAVLDQHFGGLDGLALADRAVAFFNRYAGNRGDQNPTFIEVKTMANATSQSTDSPVVPVEGATSPVAALAATPDPIVGEPAAVPVAVAAGALSSITPEALRAQIDEAVAAATLASTVRARDIAAICSTAGLPELSDEYIAGQLSVEEIKAALLDQMLAKSGKPGVKVDASGDTPADVDAKYLAEASSEPRILKMFGVTPADYARTAKAGINGRPPVPAAS